MLSELPGRTPRSAGRRRRLALTAFVLLAACGAAVSLAAPELVADLSRRAALACEAAGPAGWALVIAGQVAIAASGILPASLFGVLAGALYGPVLGFALAAAGTLAGAGLSFTVGRAWAGRARGEREAGRRAVGSERLRRIDAMVARDGWRAVCLLRLSPVMPFALASWALSLSRVTTPAYLVGTLACLPSLLAYVLIGSLGQAGGLNGGLGGLLRTDAAGLLHDLLLGLGAAATLLLALRVRRALSRDVGDIEAAPQ